MIAGSKVSEKTSSYTEFIFQHKGSKNEVRRESNEPNVGQIDSFANFQNLLNALVNSKLLNLKFKERYLFTLWLNPVDTLSLILPQLLQTLTLKRGKPNKKSHFYVKVNPSLLL